MQTLSLSQFKRLTAVDYSHQHEAIRIESFGKTVGYFVPPAIHNNLHESLENAITAMIDLGAPSSLAELVEARSALAASQDTPQ